MESDRMDVLGDTITGTDGEDFIDGTEGNDQIFGGGQSDDIFGLGGNDIINGGAGDDFINGDAGDDTIIGGSGGDVLRGDSGNDVIDGGDEPDDLAGGSGDDSVFGGAGDDTIFFGEGNDYLVGGDGADSFVFTPDEGHHTIADFQIGNDRISIFDSVSNQIQIISDFAEIEDQLIQDGDDALIAVSATRSIRLLDTQLDDLLAATPANDGDIPGDSSTTATIAVGQTIESTIEPSRDVDAFALSLEAGQNINISHEGGRQVTLRDADGNIVASSFGDFRTGSLSNEDFVFQAEEADTYFLTVESFIPPSVSDDDLLGFPIDYSVTVTEFADDHGNFASNATSLSQGNNIIEGQFEHIEDSDAFTVFLTEGQVLSLNLDGDIFRPTTTVLGPDGEDATGLVLDTTIGRSGATNREQQIVATVDGFYTVIVNNRNDFFDPTSEVVPENPDYTLTTSILGDARLALDNDIGDTLADATQIASGDTIVSDISSVDDTDVFAINLTAGQTVSLSTIADFAQTASILDADGNIVADFPSTFLDNAARVFQGELEFTAEDSGTFFISIANNDDRLIDQLYILEANIAGGAPAPIPDRIVGTDDADTLVGTDSDDVILGARGNDAIFGGAGDDIIDSGAGNDYLVGEGGADLFVFGDGDGHDTIDGFEIGVDSLEISGVRIDNLSDISPLLSQDGQDVLIGLSAQQSIRLVNTSLDDVLNGSVDDPADDPADDDGAADNVITGTNGNDTLSIDESTGNNVVNGGDGNDFINADTSSGDNTLNGGNGDDIFSIVDSIGNNVVNGGDGQDFVDAFFSSGDNILNGGNGDDEFLFTDSFGNNVINGDAGNDVIDVFFSQGNNTLNGGDDDDTLVDGLGDDTLLGGNGADILTTGAGNDYLVGGNGADIFEIDAGSEFTFTGSGHDTIADFGNGNDRLDLSGFDFDNFNQLNLVEQNGSTFIFIDENTSIQLQGVEIEDLSAEDFIL